MSEDHLIRDDGKRIPLPENWETLNHSEKDLFFHCYYLKYMREGETAGLYSWAPDEVKAAFDAFRKESN